MKRIKRLFMIVICIAISLSATACGEKKAISAETFKTKMENKKFLVQDSSLQFSEYKYIEKSFVALADNKKYQIEFYILDSDKNAAKFFDSNKKIFENNKKASSIKIENGFGNHEKYSLTSNGNFYVVSRIGNTIMYANADKEYKSDINKIIDEFDY